VEDEPTMTGGALRPCHGPNSRWWDADATIEEHAKALPICHACPFKYQCCDETRVRFDQVTNRRKRRDMAGLYAGLMWGEIGGPVSIWEWPKVQKVKQPREKPPVYGPVRPPPPVVQCERPGCTKTFVRDGRRNRKRFHDKSCADRERWSRWSG
jgi:hypothetical protein